jgi:hypothetical protein
MKTACKILMGLMLMVAVSGCRCLGDGWCDTCGLSAPNPALAATMTPPHVTMQ